MAFQIAREGVEVANLFGNNGWVGWGLTIVGTDQADVCVEQLKPDDPERVFWRGISGSPYDRSGYHNSSGTRAPPPRQSPEELRQMR